MLNDVEVLKILNHNGSNRRYSKDDAKQLTDFFKVLTEELVKLVLPTMVEGKKNENKL
jgi:hypothetical protein